MDHVVFNESALFDCSSQMEPFQCKTCPNFQTNFLESLRQHSMSSHLEGKTKEVIYKCVRCSSVTSSRFLHFRHTLLGACAATDEEEKKKRLVCSTDDDLPLKLKDGPITSSEEILERDERSMTQRQPRWFECDQRTLKLERKENLTDLAKPKNTRWYKCDQCPSRSQHKSAFRNHIIRRHSNPEHIQWFECGQCSAKFKVNGDLKSHVKHRHSKPEDIQWFICNECTSKFKQKGDLKVHIRFRHSKPEEIQWFRCGRCPSKFKRNGHLRRHAASCHLKAY